MGYFSPIPIAKGMNTTNAGSLADAHEEIKRLESTNKALAAELDRLIGELHKETARLDWFLPRQYSHQTREIIDKEL